MSEAGKTAEKTILVVDDEPDIALVLTTTFEDAGYRVAARLSGVTMWSACSPPTRRT